MAQPLPTPDNTFTGANIEIAVGSTEDGQINRFIGTPGRDTWVGGAWLSIYTGSAGNDIFAQNTFDDPFFGDWVDYGAAPAAVTVSLKAFGGLTQTFTDQSGDVRTIPIKGGAAIDGYGGFDLFMQGTYLNTSFIENINGSRYNDILIGDDDYNDLNGNGGNDTILSSGGFDGLYGDDGNDLLIAGDSNGDWGNLLDGGAGNDLLMSGNGDDELIGGTGADTLVSGAGNDFLSPDGRDFNYEPAGRATDGSRDIIRITADDLGEYRDFVFSRAFEPGTDRVEFGAALGGSQSFAFPGFANITLPNIQMPQIPGIDLNLSLPDLSGFAISPFPSGGGFGGSDGSGGVKNFRVFYENSSIGEISYADDAELPNTVLQIDYNRNGFDATDYFLVVLDATLHQEGSSFVLT
jgi:Ca2+-binding RTX toxin-like protein